MKIVVGHVGGERLRGKSSALDAATAGFLERAGRYETCEAIRFATEEAVLDWVKGRPGRTPARLVLLDRAGKALSSEQFAAHLGGLRDSGVQTVLYAIGPADGWTDRARAAADHVISFGPITLPHELARLVLAEQLYRALSIIAGHPYHCGH